MVPDKKTGEFPSALKVNDRQTLVFRGAVGPCLKGSIMVRSLKNDSSIIAGSVAFTPLP